MRKLKEKKLNQSSLGLRSTDYSLQSTDSSLRPAYRQSLIAHRQRGFTLIELLVVVSIIGLLASIVLTSLNAARTKARDSQRLANVQQMMRALELYYDDNGEYPQSGGATSPNSGWDNSNDSSWDNLVSELEPYIQLPVDPTNTASGWANQSNTYTLNYFSRGYGCDQQWYMIVFALENPGTVDSPGVTACNGTTFNYTGTGSITIGVNGISN